MEGGREGAYSKWREGGRELLSVQGGGGLL